MKHNGHEMVCNCGGNVILAKDNVIFKEKYAIFCEFHICKKCGEKSFDGKQLERVSEEFEKLQMKQPVALEIPKHKSFLLI